MQPIDVLPSLVLSLVFAGCGEGVDRGTRGRQSPRPPVVKAAVALVAKTMTNPFFVEMGKGARQGGDWNSALRLIVKTAAQEPHSNSRGFDRRRSSSRTKRADALSDRPAEYTIW